MSRAFRRFAVAGTLVLAGVATGLAVGLAVVYTADAKKAGDWAFYSADNSATKYSAADQINKDNVAGLRVAWRRPQVDPAILAANAGLRISNRFTASHHGERRALRPMARSGRSRPGDRTDAVQLPLTPEPMASRRRRALGVALASGPDERIYTTRAQHLFALNAKTGAHRRFRRRRQGDLNVGLGPLMKASLERRSSSPATSSSSVADARAGLGENHGGASGRRARA
jgi:hypothetical protein